MEPEASSRKMVRLPARPQGRTVHYEQAVKLS